MVTGPQFQKFRPLYLDEKSESFIYFESKDGCLRIRESNNIIRPPCFMIETREALDKSWMIAQSFKSVKAAHARFIEVLDAREKENFK